VAATEALKERHDRGQERGRVLGPEDEALQERVEVGVGVKDVHIDCAPHPVARLVLGQEDVLCIRPVLVPEARERVPDERATLLALADATENARRRILCRALTAGHLVRLNVVEEAHQCAAAIAPVALDVCKDDAGLAARNGDHRPPTNNGDEIGAPQRCNERIDVPAAPDTPLHATLVTSKLSSEIRRHLDD